MLYYVLKDLTVPILAEQLLTKMPVLYEITSNLKLFDIFMTIAVFLKNFLQYLERDRPTPSALQILWQGHNLVF